MPFFMIHDYLICKFTDMYYSAILEQLALIVNASAPMVHWFRAKAENCSGEGGKCDWARCGSQMGLQVLGGERNFVGQCNVYKMLKVLVRLGCKRLVFDLTRISLNELDSLAIRIASGIRSLVSLLGLPGTGERLNDAWNIYRNLNATMR